MYNNVLSKVDKSWKKQFVIHLHGKDFIRITLGCFVDEVSHSVSKNVLVYGFNLDIFDI